MSRRRLAILASFSSAVALGAVIAFAYPVMTQAAPAPSGTVVLACLQKDGHVDNPSGLLALTSSDANIPPQFQYAELPFTSGTDCATVLQTLASMGFNQRELNVGATIYAVLTRGK